VRARLVLLLLAAAAGAGELEVAETVTPAFEVSQWRLIDVDRDGKTELLLVGATGEVRAWASASGHLEKEPRGRLALPDPAHTLLAVEDVLKEAKPQLVALSPAGAIAYRVADDGCYGGDPVTIAGRARFLLRTNEPVFADVCQDINSDGRLDLIVPGNDTTEGRLNGEKGFRRSARIAVDIARRDETDADALSDSLSSSFLVPRLVTEDVNGDGRLDLLVTTGRHRAFHIQRPDGTLPAEPDVNLNLNIFRDTTPRAALRPGRTLGGSDKTRYVSRDLDADGIPDYVIAHRRKVWVFHGNHDKPQFTEPTTILKVSDDLTLLMVARLDDDKYPDLLLFKVQVPTMASLVVGLVSEFDIEISALGYKNLGGRDFERSPTWRSEIVVRIPPIVKILKNPGELIERFEDVGRKFRLERRADLDGDGYPDTVLLSEDRTRLEMWRGSKANAEVEATIDVDRTLRRILFEDENKRWDLDRILGFLTEMAEQRTRDLTGGRPPDLTFAVRDAERFELLDYGLGDVDGDGKAELLVRYAPKGAQAASVFDVVRFVP